MSSPSSTQVNKMETFENVVDNKTIDSDDESDFSPRKRPLRCWTLQGIIGCSTPFCITAIARTPGRARSNMLGQIESSDMKLIKFPLCEIGNHTTLLKVFNDDEKFHFNDGFDDTVTVRETNGSRTTYSSLKQCIQKAWLSRSRIGQGIFICGSF